MTIRHRPKIIHNDPEARTSGGRHQIRTPAGIGSERVAAFKSVRMAGAIGIRSWSEAGQIELDPDEHVVAAIRLVFCKFRELGSARQVFLWARQADLKLPVVQRNLAVSRIAWRVPAYHTVMQILKNPIYAGAYVFGRRGGRTQVVDGRARKTSGHRRTMSAWSVVIRDHHEAT